MLKQQEEEDIRERNEKMNRKLYELEEEQEQAKDFG